MSFCGAFESLFLLNLLNIFGSDSFLRMIGPVLKRKLLIILIDGSKYRQPAGNRGGRLAAIKAVEQNPRRSPKV